MHKNGRRGRNREFLLSLAIDLHDVEGIHALACDTDGITEPKITPGLFSPGALNRAKQLGIDACSARG